MPPPSSPPAPISSSSHLTRSSSSSSSNNTKSSISSSDKKNVKHITATQPTRVGCRMKENTHLAYFFVYDYAKSALIDKIWPKFCSEKLAAVYTEFSWNLLRGRCWLGVYVCSELSKCCQSFSLRKNGLDRG